MYAVDERILLSIPDSILFVLSPATAVSCTFLVHIQRQYVPVLAIVSAFYANGAGDSGESSSDGQYESRTLLLSGIQMREISASALSGIGYRIFSRQRYIGFRPKRETTRIWRLSRPACPSSEPVLLYYRPPDAKNGTGQW